MANPVLVEVTRGGITESLHRGAYAVVGSSGELLKSAGDISGAVFPRSAIEAFQALPLLMSGAADAYGFSDAEIALACSSHNGEPAHVKGARSMLAKASGNEEELACGSQWPMDRRDLILAHKEPQQIHNNCSGKHAGMLAFAHHAGFDPHDYWKPEHDVQKEVRRTIETVCGVDLSDAPVGIDGCSLPTWGFALERMAFGFSRLATGNGLSDEMFKAAKRIIAAAKAHPFMVAGTGRFCTRVMEAVPRAFVKTGAEGVFCGCVPHAGIGIALKCDDGHVRASEPAMAALLANLDVWTPEEQHTLQGFAEVPIKNRREIEVGVIRAVLPD